jgi:ribose transport system substrate-binding protein
MRRLHAAVVTVFVIGFAAAIFAGCRKAPAPAAATPTAVTSKKQVGVSLLTKQHVFYRDLEAGMRDAADRYGLELHVQSCEFDPKLQDSQVDDFLVQKMDALILCPADSASIVGAVKKANSAGVPVFTADIAAKGGDVVSHIASDNVMGGRLAGEYMAKALGGQGKIIIIDSPAVTSVQDRTRGFVEAISAYPGIQIVDRPSAEGQRALAHEKMQNMLQKHPDLRGVFGINDDSALGALAAIRASRGHENIVIVGYDATPEARKEILAGSQLRADSVQYPKVMGEVACQIVALHLQGDPVPKIMPIGVGIVDKESLEAEGYTPENAGG